MRAELRKIDSSNIKACAALTAIIDYFKTHGADSIRLSTKAGNRKAISLYRRFGFRENGEMNGEEIVLELSL